MNTFSEYLINKFEPYANVNEFIGLLVAGSLLAYAFTPILCKAFGGENGIFSWFNKDKKLERKEKELNRREKELDLKKREKEIKAKEEAEKNMRKDAMESLMIAKKINDQEKNDATKASTQSTIDMLSACMYDKNGKEIPFDKVKDSLQDALPAGTDMEEWSKQLKKQYDEVANNPKVIKLIKEERKKIDPKDLDKFIEDTKERAKLTWKQVEESKKETEELSNKLKELEDKLKNADDSEVEDIKKEIDKTKSDLDSAKNKNPFFKTISGKSSTKQKEEPEKDENGNIIKDEEITDPKSGKKIKVKTHTGPRGGKFYYPEGKPKTPEHKVYVESSFSNYLKDILND